MTELRTARLRLARVTVDDAEFVLALLNDPGWLRNIGDRNVRTLDEARAYIENRFAPSFWMVARDAAGAPVGICGIVAEREGLDRPDLGYALLQAASGQGYATEMAAAVLAHARGPLGLDRLAAITAPDNTASQRVLEKLGFTFRRMIELPGHTAPSAYFTI